MTKQRDARGNEVTNALDENGKLLSVTDPSGQSVNYGYDDSNRVTSVESAYTVNGEERVSRNEYTYENDRLKTVAHNTTGDAADVVYNFEYDELGRKTTVKIGEQALSTNVYSPDRKSRLDEVQYGNGGKVKYTYDEFDRVTGVGYDNDDSPRFTYEYDSKGRAAFVKDSTDGSTIRTGYDQTDRPNETEQRDGEGNLKYRTLIEYDKKNRVKAFNEATADASFKTEYTYDADNRVTKVRYNSSETSKVDYGYDKLNRITSRTVTNGTSSYATQYAYVPGATAYGEKATTPLVSSITQGEGENAMNFAYEYDNRGNIISETRNGLTTTYVYDALGQLVRVNDPHENATWVYAYDRGGNIQNKARYAYTTDGELGEAIESIPYTYGDANWKDKLTAYNGVPITYDAIGNPLSDGTWTYEWQAGRQLKSMTNAATGVTMEFTYNYAGLRTKKVKSVNGILAETTEYILNGKKIVGLTHTDHASNEVDTVRFLYDAQGKVTQADFNDAVYSYVHNFQGDIVGMLDSSGCLMVKYTYNAWGGLLIVEGALANTLGRRNPFMYRGYMFDGETKLYYLRSRYYSSLIGKFINMDNVIGTNKALLNNHLFAYARNNPIMYVDSSGQWCERIECWLASGEMKEKNIFVEGDRLYTGRREVYQLNRPLTGATNGAEYQTIASGKASSSFFHAERALATPFELDEDNQFTSLINFVNMVKNAISWVDMNVYIESSQEGATRARVTVQFHSNISIDAFDTGLYENANVDSPVLTLIEMTSERGYFWDGNRGIYISNDQQWLTSLISKVELEG